MNTVLYCSLNQIKSICILLHPIIPQSIEKILESIGIDKENILLKNIKNTSLLEVGYKIKKTNILFKKIEK